MVSSAGSEAVDLAAAAGLVLDDWQSWVLEEALAERADGTWAAFEVGLVLPRQNGKNAILEARELAGVVLFDDDLIVHTAHRRDTMIEHFRRMRQLAEEVEEFRKLVKRVVLRTGEESIELKGNRRINFAARARNPGRGFSGSVLVFDEAFDLNAAAIGAMVPALATRPMAQVWYTSSAPHATSEVLHAVRKRGHQAEGDRLFWAEWGNDADVDPQDWDAIYGANPGMGIRISEDFVASERDLMGDVPAEFARERLGVAEEPLSATAGPISVDGWEDLTDPDSRIDGRVTLAFDVSPDRAWASFAVAGRRSDGLGHVEVRDRRAGTDWVVDRGVELARGHGAPVLLDPVSPAGSFVAELRERGVEVVEVPRREMTQACGAIADAVKNRKLRHLGQASLRQAVAGAKSRPLDDAWAWSRKSSQVDITPLVAATLAWGRVPVPGTADPAANVW